MHAEIELVKGKIEESFRRQRHYLMSQSTPYLEDLKHECQALTNSRSNLVVTAAAINQAACEVVLEERQSTGGSRGSRGL